MRALSATELLSVWERGAGLGSLARAELLLRAASEPGRDPAPAQLSLGERDARLLTLREWTFGADVTATSRCPTCHAEVELQFQIGDVRVSPGEQPAEQTLSADGYTVEFRLPTCGDLATASEEGTSETALRRRLVERCVSRVEREGNEITSESVPEKVLDSLSARLSELDPQAEIELVLACESCHERWHELFDVEPFFWAEIQAWAGRLLREVHQLAASYGWAESAILAMSPLRRSLYLNLITG
jgi:hypothetical protein